MIPASSTQLGQWEERVSATDWTAYAPTLILSRSQAAGRIRC